METTVDEYQNKVTLVKKYVKGQEDLYLLAKLTEEAGEVAKEIRRKVEGIDTCKDLTSELGDLLWCITAIAERNDIAMSKVIEANLEKLKQRGLL